MVDNMKDPLSPASTPQIPIEPAKAVALGHLLAEKVSELTTTLSASKTLTPNGDEDK